jgi:hypothetical protein
VCPATTREISSPRRMQTPSEMRSPASQGIPQRMASPLLMPRGGSPRGRQGGHRPQSEYPGISQTPSVGGRSMRGTEDGGHHGAHQQVYLSLSGVMAGDDRAFDFLYDREDFRAKALEILQKLIPPDRKELGSKKGPSSKRDLPPQWITLCAQQINEAFKLQMKKIITTSRSHNDGEREVLASWLTQRDQVLKIPRARPLHWTRNPRHSLSLSLSLSHTHTHSLTHTHTHTHTHSLTHSLTSLSFLRFKARAI